MVTFEPSVIEQAQRALLDAEDRQLCLVLVESTWGSSPRKRGSLLWVTLQGDFGGSVSAGCLEAEVIAEGIQHLQTKKRYHQQRYHINDALAWQHGLSCGGEVALLFIRLDFSDRAWLQQWLERVTEEQAFTLSIAFPERPTLIKQSLSQPSKSIQPPVEESDVITFQHIPMLNIICIGAVPITQSLSIYAQTLGCAVTVIEPRASWRKAYPVAEARLETEWPVDAMCLQKITNQTAVVALTHDPKIDDQALAIALRSDCFYIGALGSQHSQEKRVHRLAELGFAYNMLRARIHGPVGLDIAATNPAQIALATVAEIIACWNAIARP